MRSGSVVIAASPATLLVVVAGFQYIYTVDGRITLFVQMLPVTIYQVTRNVLIDSLPRDSIASVLILVRFSHPRCRAGCGSAQKAFGRIATRFGVSAGRDSRLNTDCSRFLSLTRTRDVPVHPTGERPITRASPLIDLSSEREPSTV